MKHQPDFKETQLFDWDTEPRFERSSSSFFPDEVTAAEPRRAKNRQSQAGRRNLTLIAVVCAISIGAGVLLQMGPLLHRFTG